MSAAEVEQAWMNSAGHRANILNGGYNVAGVGVACNGFGQLYATQNFGQV